MVEREGGRREGNESRVSFKASRFPLLDDRENVPIRLGRSPLLSKEKKQGKLDDE